MKKPMIDTMERPKFDNLYTPPEAIYPLLNYLPMTGTFWECTDFGTSNITKVLMASGRNVIGTDIINGFDFLKEDQTKDFSVIITNPPYSLKDVFLQRCYDYHKPFALLLPLTALEGIKRNKMFNKYGVSIIVLDKRVDFTGKGSNWFNASWFTWGLFDGKEGNLVFETVEK